MQLRSLTQRRPAKHGAEDFPRQHSGQSDPGRFIRIKLIIDPDDVGGVADKLIDIPATFIGQRADLVDMRTFVMAARVIKPREADPQESKKEQRHATLLPYQAGPSFLPKGQHNPGIMPKSSGASSFR